jgi:hypothetical protein
LLCIKNTLSRSTYSREKTLLLNATIINTINDIINCFVYIMKIPFIFIFVTMFYLTMLIQFI